jgi:hypothetical protein
MSSRRLNIGIALIFLLTVPAGVFFFFTSPGMGYAKGTAAIIAGALAIAGVALLTVALRTKPSESARGAALPGRAAWAVLIGFLILMAAVVAYFMMREP